MYVVQRQEMLTSPRVFQCICSYVVRKFGKQIQRQQLDLPEYAAHFLNYKALKKVTMTTSYRTKADAQIRSSSSN